MTDQKNAQWLDQLEIIRDRISHAMSLPVASVSQQRIADFLGATKGKVRAWEGGQRPSADDLETIARKLSLSAQWLLLREGDPDGAAQPAVASAASPADPIVQRLIETERILRAANAPDETIRQAVFEVLRGQDAPVNRTDEESAAPEFRKVGNGG